jgi:peptidoglycan/LPS O-acetylase OafA/YrhL
MIVVTALSSPAQTSAHTGKSPVLLKTHSTAAMRHRSSHLLEGCCESSGGTFLSLRKPIYLWRKIDQEAQHRLACLDGLRALAALAVLCSHAGLLPVPFGTLGVFLFFNLSAFLLSGPFIISDHIYSWRGIASFIVRRIFRIIPMMIVYIFTYGVFIDGGLTYIIDNTIRFRGYGHLWTINQEMLFYVLMPGFGVLVFHLRKWPQLAAVVFIALAFAADAYLTYSIFRIPGMTGYMQFFLSPFLVGMAAAYLGPYIKHPIARLRCNVLFDNLVPICLLGCLISLQWIMVRIYVETGANVVGNWAIWVSVSCSALILWTTCASGNWLSAILSFRPLRIIGIVGYSFYLWHWVPIILLPQGWAPLLRFSVAFVATFSLSLVTFLIIERPGITLGAKVASMLSPTPPWQPIWTGNGIDMRNASKT